ncbi:hypothetical protein C8Q77DRAFT_1128890 [Trametes polyzona]|nr:hypothetical protein C8Q77DRAFT_1128890 [Trametes polyzona]
MDAAWKNRTNSAAAFEPGELAAWDFSPLLSLPSLDNTFGAFLIGTFLSLILYGICVHQAYRYFRLYQRDGAVIKTVVAAMIIGETLYAAVCMHACYYYLVTNYFDPLSLLRGVWSIQLLSLLTGALIFISQSFFSWRVYILRPRLSPLVTIAVFFSIVSFGTPSNHLKHLDLRVSTYRSMMCHNYRFLDRRNHGRVGSIGRGPIYVTTDRSSPTIPSIRVHLFSRFKHYTWLDSIALGAAVISDLITTSVLTIVLTQSRTGVRQYVRATPTRG